MCWLLAAGAVDHWYLGGACHAASDGARLKEKHDAAGGNLPVGKCVMMT